MANFKSGVHHSQLHTGPMPACCDRLRHFQVGSGHAAAVSEGRLSGVAQMPLLCKKRVAATPARRALAGLAAHGHAAFGIGAESIIELVCRLQARAGGRGFAAQVHAYEVVFVRRELLNRKVKFANVAEHLFKEIVGWRDFVGGDSVNIGDEATVGRPLSHQRLGFCHSFGELRQHHHDNRILGDLDNAVSQRQQLRFSTLLTTAAAEALVHRRRLAVLKLQRYR